MNKKCFWSFILTIIAVLGLIQIDIGDVFSYGYFSDSPMYENIYEDDIKGTIDIEPDGYSIEFKPVKKHFAGFVLYFTNQPENNIGTVRLDIYQKERKIDTIKVDLSKVQEHESYNVYVHKTLKKGEKYTVKIYVDACQTEPQLIKIDEDYLSKESINSDVLIGYAYKTSTFTYSEKILISLFIIGILMIIISLIYEKKEKYKCIYLGGVSILLIILMAWNYSYNSLDTQNTTFKDFDKWSECLVTTTIKADQSGYRQNLRSGLNFYTDVTGNWNEYDKSFITDDNWTKGYSNTEPQILLRTSQYIKDLAVNGNIILFKNGEQYQIKDANVDETWTIITVDSNRLLNWWKYGDLSEIRFLDPNGNLLEKGYLGSYESQYGLQGKVFKHLARRLDVDLLRVITALAAATVFFIIVILINKKYNLLFASIYYIIFLLSPWIVNFANNLYWVEFTWFIPMIGGLLCTLKINEKKYRLFSYCLIYFSILIKCLCGYEYISVIMMSSISFALVDLLIAIVNKEKKKQILLLRTIIIIGIVALCGFFTAMCIHAPLKSAANGSVLKGLQIIFKEDVMRRTKGLEINNVNMLSNSDVSAALTSTWTVICRYFHFDTEVILGIEGNLFPIICIVPILIWVNNKRNNKLNIAEIGLYIIGLVSTLSWFVLAKNHSYVHTHLNYVLWYFGFVQGCFYIIVNKIANMIKKVK